MTTPTTHAGRALLPRWPTPDPLLDDALVPLLRSCAHDMPLSDRDIEVLAYRLAHSPLRFVPTPDPLLAAPDRLAAGVRALPLQHNHGVPVSPIPMRLDEYRAAVLSLIEEARNG